MPRFADLNTTWFALIGLLWAGYFFLEGFDFGVAIVTPLVAADETDRRICLNSVGPVWDGNEVWLLTAGGATFAAFPLWYARLFSGFYLALFLVLLALIARGVSFEFRGKFDSPRWRRTWDWANFAGSLVPAIVWGAAFTDLVHGVPLAPDGRYYGGLIGLLHPVALAGGLASLALFAFHGSVFLSLKTSGDLRGARAASRIHVGYRRHCARRYDGGLGGPSGTACDAGRYQRHIAACARGSCERRGGRGLRRRTERPGRVGLCIDRLGDPAGDGGRVRPHVPRGPAGQQPRSQRHNDRCCRLAAQHPGGDDHRCGDLRPLRAGLHSLDLLGVPSALDTATGRRYQCGCQRRRTGEGDRARSRQCVTPRRRPALEMAARSIGL